MSSQLSERTLPLRSLVERAVGRLIEFFRAGTVRPARPVRGACYSSRGANDRPRGATLTRPNLIKMTHNSHHVIAR